MTNEIWNQFPIGTHDLQPFSSTAWKECLSNIRFLPRELELVVQHLDKDQLDTPYRPGAWSIHTLVHHLADSHLNAYTRCKFAILEPGKTIPGYDENAWVTTADVQQQPINYALTLLHALHHKWHTLLGGISHNQAANSYVFHGALNREAALWELVSTYSWHGLHHKQQIINAIEKYFTHAPNT